MELRPEAIGTYRRTARPGLRHLDLGPPAPVDLLLADVGTLSFVIIATNPASLEWCEREPDASRREMVDDVAGFLERLRQGSPRAEVVYLSTDYVFNGAKGHYSEDDPPRPLQVYGRHKLAAERAVLESGLRARVIRTSFLYGENRWEPAADRTPPLVFVSAARRRARTVVTDDLFSSPTEARSLAALLWSLEGIDGEDVLHAAGGPRVCRRDVLDATLEVWGLPPWPGIEVVHADAEGRIPGQTLRRPRDSSLDSSRMRALTGSSLPELRDGLRAVSRRVKAAGAADA